MERWRLFLERHGRALAVLWCRACQRRSSSGEVVQIGHSEARAYAIVTLASESMACRFELVLYISFPVISMDCLFSSAFAISSLCLLVRSNLEVSPRRQSRGGRHF